MNPDAIFDHVVDQYSRFLNPGLARLMAFAGFGVEVHAEGCIITDHAGNQYLDSLGGYGVFALGHRHPAVISAVKAQLDKMPLGGKAFFNSIQADLAEKLAQISSEGLQFSFFCNSGTEAVEAALKFAKAFSGRSGILSTNGSYHGKTIGALSTTGREKYRKPFLPLMPGVEFVDFGDSEAACKAITTDTAAVIIETVQGEGGINVAPLGYLQQLRKRCDETGALLIVDEVQTGLGRTGALWGCDHEEIRPDLMTLAKALGGGVMPIGAVVGTEEVFTKVFEINPLAHTSTFGGNELACAAGLATIKVIEDEDLVARSRDQGAKLLKGLATVRAQHPDFISDVRGQGLMIGVEFGLDEFGELVIAQMLKRGMCAAYTLNNPRVIRFEPPLIISDAQIDQAVSTFGEAVTETVELCAAFA